MASQDMNISASRNEGFQGSGCFEAQTGQKMGC